MDSSLFLASEGRRAAIAQQEENSTRSAMSALTYTTTGTGQIILDQPLMFNATFIEEPALSTGKHLEKLDDPRVWQYPVADAGIWRWERDSNGYYTGAYVYFTIQVNLLPGGAATQEDYDAAAALGRVAADAQVLAAQDTLRLTARDSLQYLQAQQDLAQAQKIAGLAKVAEVGPQPKITHHLVFQGVAMKEMPQTVTGNLNAGSMGVRTVPLMGGQS